MKISKIKSFFAFQQLFSFISEKRKYKIIKYNSFLHKKLDLSSKDYQEFFFQEIIEKYNYNYINIFWIQFQNYFKRIILKDTYNLFLNALSKKKDFNLKLSDNCFNLMIANTYFKNNIRIEIETMNYELLSTMLIINKIFKEAFDSFSTNGRMSKEQSLNYLKSIKRKNNENKKLFSYDIDNDEFLLFEEFLKYYYDLIKKNSNHVKKDLNNLGYNNIFNNNYDLYYLQSHLDEFEKYKTISNNFIQILQEKINKLRLYSQIDDICINFLKDKDIFNNLKQLEISIENFIMFISLDIECINLEELTLYIENNLDYNKKEIINIFPNLITLKIYSKKKVDLIDLLRNLKNSNIETLEIYCKNEENQIEYVEKENDYINLKLIKFKIKQNIILSSIKNLKIESNYEIFFKLFQKFQFPNLKNYQLNLHFFKINQNIDEIIDDNDYNSINIFITKILNKKNKFLLNDFVNIPNILRKINYLKINLGIYLFVYDGIKRKKNNFEFILYDETKFKNYYLDFDFYIDEKEISKYKKIKIEGLSKLNNIKTYNLELIEDNNANLCYINFNINKHYIKSLKEIKSIYCEKEIQNTNFILIIKKIINENG